MRAGLGAALLWGATALPGAAANCALAPASAAPPADQLTALTLCAALGEGAAVAGFSLEIAATEAERARGLMARANMPEGQGMLFVYPNPRPVAFWMHDTLLPLDMLFIDAQGMVVRVHQNARPLDETPIPSGGPVQYVLEINGGLARKLGIAEGMLVPELAVLAQ